MNVGDRLRQLREAKNFSQGDIEQRSGLLRCYISRVENGHTVPAVETLEKMARALEIPLYQIFYEGSDEPPVERHPLPAVDRNDWASEGKGRRMFQKLGGFLSRASDEDRSLVLLVASKLGQRKRSKR